MTLSAESQTHLPACLPLRLRVPQPLVGNSTNKEDYVDWKVTTTVQPKSPTTTSNVIHEVEFTAKSLYQDDFRKWPLQKTINKKHEVERSGKRF